MMMTDAHEIKNGKETEWQDQHIHGHDCTTGSKPGNDMQRLHTVNKQFEWHIGIAQHAIKRACILESGHVPRLPQPTQICYPSRPKLRLRVYVHISASITAASRQHHGSITAASRQHQGKTQLKIKMVVF